ncbi:protein TPX2 isoform X2 [Cinnamomum micranthum f. kanehirae]|uniref:Protein TPX2 isoform X2 n=1 Tax=Cinnamomum micranthum f. kanehirae TaxID=337451 RepID=A0A443NUB7_9MAGN|nr:protein TPX2 isoform X2 [Cinnamomum micranthum f. kanehirae]
MEEPKSNSSSPKSQKHPSSQSSQAVPVKSSHLQPFRLHTESRGQLKERAFVKRLQEINADEAKHRIRMAQGLPLTTDKPEMLHKPPVKEQTKPMEIKLRTQQRAARRAGFNDLVAIKISWLEYQRQQIEKLQKMMEEEEIKMLRKEMVPRAQLMPLFDRPFFPQRSTRPLTVPKEPNFKGLSSKSWRCTPSSGAHYKFQQPLNQTMKPIK